MIRACPSCGTKNRIAPERLAEQARCGRCKAEIPALDEPVHLSDADFEHVVTHSALPVVVDFWASWCAPCRSVAPAVAELARKYAGRVLVAKLDTEANQQTAMRYRVQSIPYFARFEAGRIIRSTKGAQPASALEAQLF